MDLKEQPQGTFTRHPWELARFRFFDGVLQDHGLLARSEKLLDAGAGDGWFASQLEPLLSPGAEIVCFDSGYEADPVRDGRLLFTRRKPDDRFDLILLLDLLEHLADDRSFLAALVEENLAALGCMLVSVPAWRGLYSDHDAALGHYRRYAPRECRRMLEEAGLSVIESGGLFHTLLAPRVLQKAAGALFRGRFKEPQKPSLEWSYGGFSHRLVSKALDYDTGLSRFLAKRNILFPGLSWWALCKKR
jgi:hypothetical protein